MYTPTYFEMSEDNSFKMIQTQPFGQLLVCHNNHVTQAFIPFEVDHNERYLFAHIAKQNDLLIALQESTDVHVNFIGHHAYISPNWYQSVEQVPTWNYQAVEIRGTLTLLNEEETLSVISRLSEIHEAEFENPWTMDKLSEKKTNAMLRAIVGLRIDIREISGKSKMSQNKNHEDQNGVIEGLESQNGLSTYQEVANIMKQT
ncbi:MAG: FMN-binding negative transcriptional regulator [Kangiellaceae bacterium]